MRAPGEDRGKEAPAARLWRANGHGWDTAARGVIMGILNLTPDSFSDGGSYRSAEDAVGHALRMVEEGAGIIDIGGESTRPGSRPVSAEEELRRVMPALEALRAKTAAAISIDTSKAAVARRALDAGADIVNDVTALRGDPAMLETVACSRCGVVLMHMRGEPATMQERPEYGDVLAEVLSFLLERARAAQEAGIARERICIDPGIGFGKTFGHNRSLLAGIPALAGSGYPVMVGVSRKSFLAQAAGAAEMARRLWPGVAVTAYARERGAGVFRVHDVLPHAQALRATEEVIRHA